jgi:hypothetical protein
LTVIERPQNGRWQVVTQRFRKCGATYFSRGRKAASELIKAVDSSEQSKNLSR